MFEYEIIVYYSEGERAFIAEIPELTGCMADGASSEEAVDNAKMVIREWIASATANYDETPVPQGRLIYA